MVNRGDKVKAKQALGVIYTDTEEAKTILHFEVWQNSNNLDPELWLAKK
jgi:murein DD-endopeptidase MepM/ murein hydrolase activator NlpD